MKKPGVEDMLKDMAVLAAIGDGVVRLVRESGVIPRAKVRVVQRTKVVIRKPRRTKKEIAAEASPVVAQAVVEAAPLDGV